MQLILNLLINTTLFAMLTPLVQYFCMRKLVRIDPPKWLCRVQNIGKVLFIACVLFKCSFLDIIYTEGLVQVKF
jgi:hypothetical protein